MWRRLCHDDGIALIVALMAMMLLLPLGAALTLITTTETRIGGNYHDGVDTLYNTYWIRFARGRTTHDEAVANSRTLFYAARRAGVRRVVHVSITNPSPPPTWVPNSWLV